MSNTNFAIKTPLAMMMTATLMLAGCGGDKSASTDSSSATTASATRTAVNIGHHGEPSTLDPHKANDGIAFDVQRQMFEGLVSADDNGNVAPGMATEWTNSDDNKVWTFKLRDANWSNGDPVTAHDFVYGLRRLVDPQTTSPYAAYLADGNVVGAADIVEGKAPVDTLGVKALDDKTLEFTLTEPVPYFPDLMVLSVTYPAHQKTIETFGDKWLDPANIVVNGPYILEEHAISSHIRLKRNPSYYDDANTKIDTVNFLVVGDGEVNRYKAGDIDITDGVPPEQFKMLKEELGEEVRTRPTLATTYLEINTAKAPLDNKDVRKALSMALDRDIIAHKVLGSGQTPAYQFTPLKTSGMIEIKPDWADKTQEERSAAAKELLTKAGYSATNPLKIEILYTTSDTGKKLSSAIASIWKENLDGIVEASNLNQEWKTVLSTRNAGNYQLSLSGWGADYNEPSTFLNVLRTGNGNNSGKYSNPMYDQILNKTYTAATDGERMSYYHEAEKILLEDAPIISMYTPSGNYMVKSYLKGVSNTDPMHLYRVNKWYFE